MLQLTIIKILMLRNKNFSYKFGTTFTIRKRDLNCLSQMS